MNLDFKFDKILVMKNIDINYQNVIFKVKISKEKVFPNDLFKIEFGSSELLQIIESPVWIEEREKTFSFIHIDVKSIEQIVLLNSFALGIEEYYTKQ